MNSYYYVLAALPFLSFEEPVPYSLTEFNNFINNQFTPLILKNLKEITLNNLEPKPRFHPLFRRFQEWEISLRNYLVHLRAQAQKKDPQPFLRKISLNTLAAQTAKQAFQAENPLKAEEILLKARWDFLSSIEVGHQFDFVSLFVYKLKLEIIEQKRLLQSKSGQAELRRLGQELLANIFEN